MRHGLMSFAISDRLWKTSVSVPTCASRMPREPATSRTRELGRAGGASRRSFLRALEIRRQRGFKGYKTLTVLFNPDEEKSSPPRLTGLDSARYPPARTTCSSTSRPTPSA